MKRHKSPVLTVDVIIENGDEIVLIKHKKDWFKGKWGMPGGHVEYGETVEDAALREAKEETSLDVRLKEILGVYSDPKRDKRGHYVTTVFIADYLGGELRGKDDVADAKWFNINNLPYDEMAGDHPKILKDYLNWKKEKGTYWSTK
jgi:ADP-ribose pyrophosphatase YjhB (NUDIX family)